MARNRRNRRVNSTATSKPTAPPLVDTAAHDTALAPNLAAFGDAGAPTTVPQRSVSLAGVPPAELAATLSALGVTPSHLAATLSVLVAAVDAPTPQPKKGVTLAVMESKSVSARIKKFVSSVDEILCSLDKKMGAALSCLKLFGLNVGNDFLKKFDTSKPIDLTDNFNYAICCGVAIFLCDIVISKHPSPWAQRLSGVVLLYSVVQILWVILSYATSPYHAVFFGVCAAGFLIFKRMMTANR